MILREFVQDLYAIWRPEEEGWYEEDGEKPTFHVLEDAVRYATDVEGATEIRMVSARPTPAEETARKRRMVQMSSPQGRRELLAEILYPASHLLPKLSGVPSLQVLRQAEKILRDAERVIGRMVLRDEDWHDVTVGDPNEYADVFLARLIQKTHKGRAASRKLVSDFYKEGTGSG